MQVRIIGLVLAVVLAVPRIADACGVWHMADVEKKWKVAWVINAGSIMNARTRAKLAAIYLDTEHKDGMRAVKDRKVLFDVTGDKLRKLGKQVATFDHTSVSFGKRIYTFALERGPDSHGYPAWKVTVKRGDTVVIESAEASALCAVAHAESRGVKMPDEDQMSEIRRRIMFYLAWREVGA